MQPATRFGCASLCRIRAEGPQSWQRVGRPYLAAYVAHVPANTPHRRSTSKYWRSTCDGRTIAAEGHLRAAVLADPDYGPALTELAWYEADRGEGLRAISLLRRSGTRDDDSESDYLSSQVPTSTVSAGRNDHCPCGSGRHLLPMLHQWTQADHRAASRLALSQGRRLLASAAETPSDRRSVRADELRSEPHCIRTSLAGPRRSWDIRGWGP